MDSGKIKQPYIIGLIGIDTSPYKNQYKLLSGIVDQLKSENVNLICFPGKALECPYLVEKWENNIYNFIFSQYFDGFIINTEDLGIYVSKSKISDFVKQFISVPVVSIGKTEHDIHCLFYDYCQGSTDLTNHLIEEHNCRRIFFIRGPETNDTAQSEYKGYLNSLRQHNIPVNQNLITDPCVRWNLGFKEFKKKLTEHRIKPKKDFDAVIATGLGDIKRFYHFFYQQKLKIPDDIAVAAFGSETISLIYSPSVTSLSNSAYVKGKNAANMILSLINKEYVPKSFYIKPQITIRYSCGCSELTEFDNLKNNKISASQYFHKHKIHDEFQRPAYVNRITAVTKKKFLSLLSGIRKELSELNIRKFLESFDGIFMELQNPLLEIDSWHNALTLLKVLLNRIFHMHDCTPELKDNIEKMRLIISNKLNNLKAMKLHRNNTKSKMLKNFVFSISTVTSMENLLNVLEKYLKQFQILDCFIFYFDPEKIGLSDSTPLVKSAYKFKNGGFITIKKINKYYNNGKIITSAFFSAKKLDQYYIIKSLFAEELQLGIAVYRIEHEHTDIIDVLQQQTSTALYIIQLLNKVQDYADKTKRQKYILDTFIDNVPDAIYFKDQQSRIIRTNRAHTENFGIRNPEKVIGKTDFDFYSPSGAEKKFQQEQNIIETGNPVVNVEEPVGSSRWALTTKMPLCDEDGKIIGTFGISKDITRLKRTQEILEYTNKRTLILNEQLKNKNQHYNLLMSLFSVNAFDWLKSSMLTPVPRNIQFLATILLKSIPKNNGPASLLSEKSKLNNKCEEVIKKEFHYGQFYTLSENDSVLIVYFDKQEQVIEILHNISKRLQNILTEFDFRYVIGIGTPVDSIKKLHISFKAAQDSLLSRNTKDILQIITPDDTRKAKIEAMAYLYPESLEEKLIHAVLAGNKEQIENILDGILAQNNLDGSVYWKYLSIYERFLQTAARVLAVSPVKEKKEMMFSLIRHFQEKKPENKPELYKNVLRLFSRLAVIYRENPIPEENQLIKLIIRYLKNNYSDPNLSLESMASFFHLAPTYISRYFKKKTGMNYIKYVNNIRIKKIKDLLLYSDKKVYEIAGEVGVSSRIHLNNLFKKHVGQTPNNYRRKYKKGEKI